MSSRALLAWSTTRATRLDQLISAHGFLSGSSGPGRRTTTQAANWALTLLLASEFQGFARELHDEGCDSLASFIANGNAGFLTLVRNNMTASRELDRANAKPDSVSNDFARLGVAKLWDQIATTVHSGASWKQSIDYLNQARNGIAHNQLAKLDNLRAKGVPLNLTTIRSWRAACNGVARQMDSIVGATIKRTTGRAPW